jgi:hypothetical protein
VTGPGLVNCVLLRTVGSGTGCSRSRWLSYCQYSAFRIFMLAVCLTVRSGEHVGQGQGFGTRVWSLGLCWLCEEQGQDYCVSVGGGARACGGEGAESLLLGEVVLPNSNCWLPGPGLGASGGERGTMMATVSFWRW